jgi:recombination protein RecT
MAKENTELATTQSNELAKKPATPMQAIKSYFTADSVKGRFHEIMGKKAQGFVASILQVVSQSEALQKVDPATIYQSAMMAATLDLPINQNLGFAYIIGYGNKATFQMGYKGYIQLAQRSGLFKTISAAPIFEGQLIEQNPLTGFVFDFTKKSSEKIIGYAAYFELLNGFSKTMFMTEKELNDHGARFSQTFKKGFGLWKEDFNSMAIKTVLKLLLSKFAPLSIEMQRAVIADQSVIHDAETLDVDYVDNTEQFKTGAAEVEMDNLINQINSAKSKAELESLGTIPDQLLDLYNEKLTSL